jgi:cytochrome c biogenesis protein CcmG, thiol:disulfide interchange protein DsbE
MNRILARRLGIWAGVGVFAAALILFILPTYRQGEASVAGKTAKDFTLTYHGKPQHLSDLRGKVVVVNFWATWCPPCKDETPSLNKLQKYIEARNGTVLGVSADEDAEAYKRFLQTEGVVFPTYRDPTTKGSVSDIARSYGTSVYPETYVIDRNGKIARKFVGFQQWDSPDMLAYFDTLLKQS